MCDPPARKEGVWETSLESGRPTILLEWCPRSTSPGRWRGCSTPIRAFPAHLRDPANWPEPMRAEWGDDEGITSFKAHRERVFSRVPDPPRGDRRVPTRLHRDVGRRPVRELPRGRDPAVLRARLRRRSRSAVQAAAAAGRTSGASRATRRSPGRGSPRPGACSPAGCWRRASTWRTPTARCTATAWPTRSRTRCCTSISTAGTSRIRSCRSR